MRNPDYQHLPKIGPPTVTNGLTRTENPASENPAAASVRGPACGKLPVGRLDLAAAGQQESKKRMYGPECRQDSPLAAAKSSASGRPAGGPFPCPPQSPALHRETAPKTGRGFRASWLLRWTRGVALKARAPCSRHVHLRERLLASSLSSRPWKYLGRISGGGEQARSSEISGRSAQAAHPTGRTVVPIAMGSAAGRCRHAS